MDTRPYCAAGIHPRQTGRSANAIRQLGADQRLIFRIRMDSVVTANVVRLAVVR